MSPLARDIAWLYARLEEIEAAKSRRDADRVRSAASAMLETGELDAALAQMDPEEIHAVLKLLAIRFHLRNKAEQIHIARVNRRRERDATPQNPRPESTGEAVCTLRSDGLSLAELQQTIAALDITPTLTAHPTESRRRSVIQKQSRIAELVAINDIEGATPVERTRAESEARQTLALLLGTDEVRARRLEVIDEVRNGINFLAGAIWDAVPGLYQDLAEAIETCYDGATPELPIFLRYRSWIGGDRDGNPNVTAEVTLRTFREMSAAAIAGHADALVMLHQQLSLSDRRVPIDPALLESVARDEKIHALDPEERRHLRHEPFREKIQHMQARLGQPGYSAEDFVEDLLVLKRALKYAGLEEIASRGVLAHAIIRARTFGFHLAALDVRQHSRVHEAAVAEMLADAGVEPDYAALDEPARLQLLRKELETSRPLLSHEASSRLSEQTRELLDTLHTIAEALRREPASVGSWIISMAHDVSDVLEVIILFREAGLWTISDAGVECPIDIAPLFETVEDLDTCDAIMTALFAEPAYAGQLAARENLQEIMLGYSDSNKDGGYWAANWRLQSAQDQLARVCRDAGVSFRFFHGRGGTVARGGGRAHRAILASPPTSRNGRIRFTEQGEVISFRYAMPAIAHRHLEQIVNAMILATAHRGRAEDPDPSPRDDRAASTSREHTDAAPLMDALAADSRTAYRELIDDDSFWPWFVDRSPVLHIGELPIASRPVSRGGGRTRLENLRAIPWVFAWTQMRYNAPGWYGIGAAFEAAFAQDQSNLELCRDLYGAPGCFRAFIDNAQQEMARARLPVAQWYAGAADDSFHAQLASEFERARTAIMNITNQHALLDNNPVIQQSIRERNPDTDAINALQVELLRRWRETDDDDSREELRRLILLSVNALAAAMQSTG